MAFHIYAATVDSGVYANPTTLWLKTTDWTWNTRDYLGGTWSVDTSQGGVGSFTLFNVLPYSPILSSSEAAYLPLTMFYIDIDYPLYYPEFISGSWAPCLLIYAVPAPEYSGASISSSFYGSVAYTAATDLVRSS